MHETPFFQVITFPMLRQEVKQTFMFIVIMLWHKVEVEETADLNI